MVYMHASICIRVRISRCTRYSILCACCANDIYDAAAVLDFILYIYDDDDDLPRLEDAILSRLLSST